MQSALRNYAKLIRLDKPVGTLLLLWPTLWGLWLAAGGMPSLHLLLVFSAGVFLMRSAGCVINDIFDRNFDGHVNRTQMRPIAAGLVSVRAALLLAAILSLTAFALVLTCNWLTIFLACAGALIVVIYPLLKRVTHLPQLGLGIAFSWGVPMAFAAVTGRVPASAWLVFVTAALWPVIYDTMYAMVDRDDDVKIGVKSTAILFGTRDIFWLGLLVITFLCLLVLTGMIFQLRPVYYACVLLAAAMFALQLWRIRTRDPQQCWRAFLQNNWVGMVIFLGVAL